MAHEVTLLLGAKPTMPYFLSTRKGKQLACFVAAHQFDEITLITSILTILPAHSLHFHLITGHTT